MNYLNPTSTTTPTIHINLPFLPLDMGLPFIGSAGLGFMLNLTPMNEEQCHKRTTLIY